MYKWGERLLLQNNSVKYRGKEGNRKITIRHKPHNNDSRSGT